VRPRGRIRTGTAGRRSRRLDRRGRNRQRINDGAHQWSWTGKAISGDPEVYGRVYIATNGRGLIYGDIAD
jgi:hypothetical protein